MKELFNDGMMIVIVFENWASIVNSIALLRMVTLNCYDEIFKYVAT